MPEARLLVDLGNSRVKWLWARGQELDFASAGRGDLADFRRACRSRGAERPAAVRVSSVAGAERTAQLVDFCTALWAIRPQVLTAQAEQGGVRNGYDEPATLGVDRWLAIVGAVSHHGKPVVVWDLGTATTLDAVDGSGQHLGGLILPGPATMLDALARRTQLDLAGTREWSGEPRPGRSTRECIAQGVLAAQAGALARFLERVSERMSAQPRLVATGGAAEAIVAGCGIDCVYDPWLVFRGLSMA